MGGARSVCLGREERRCGGVGGPSNRRVRSEQGSGVRRVVVDGAFGGDEGREGEDLVHRRWWRGGFLVVLMEMEEDGSEELADDEEGEE
ncbi:hypothetical protein HAX54_013738 [Datura stramonium]|uniref:Uncharacterized protein n=1 Tax=Datura stramonium TaxID=4076 RepID=A0ABS8Y1W0_DATST|nr:hypothetical protein [Datura stramonium]